MKKETIKKLKKKLEEEKRKLENLLSRFSKKNLTIKDDWQTIFPSLKEQKLDLKSDEVEEYINNLPVEYALETRLRDINHALEKIKNRTYGICERCKKPISLNLLNVFPESKYCKNCLKELRKEK